MSATATNWSEHTAPDGRSYYYESVSGTSSWVKPPELGGPQPYPSPQGFGGGFDGGRGGQAGYGGGGFSGEYAPMAAGYGAYAAPIVGPGPPIQKGKSAAGPPGSNLFIFHIPNEMTNRDLYQLFAPFGNVISARIMVERETGRSRGFGFVSYDSPAGANAAIGAMDGYLLGKKRLKVAHKKEHNGGYEQQPGPYGGGGGMYGGGSSGPSEGSSAGAPSGPYSPQFGRGPAQLYGGPGGAFAPHSYAAGPGGVGGGPAQLYGGMPPGEGVSPGGANNSRPVSDSSVAPLSSTVDGGSGGGGGHASQGQILSPHGGQAGTGGTTNGGGAPAVAVDAGGK